MSKKSPKAPTSSTMTEAQIVAAAKKHHLASKAHPLFALAKRHMKRAPGPGPILSSTVSLESRCVILVDAVGFTIYNFRAFKSGRIAFHFDRSFTHDYAHEALREMRAEAKELRAKLGAMEVA